MSRPGNKLRPLLAARRIEETTDDPVLLRQALVVRMCAGQPADLAEATQRRNVDRAARGVGA